MCALNKAIWRARPCSIKTRARKPPILPRRGFSHLHIVDLDGAFAGASVNRAAVEAIVEACRVANVTTQLGGGIRNLENIELWLAAGIDRVILGTVAQRDPDLVRAACRQFDGRIIVGIDARAGHVAVEGWAEATQMQAVDLARNLKMPAWRRLSIPILTVTAC